MIYTMNDFGFSAGQYIYDGYCTVFMDKLEESPDDIEEQYNEWLNSPQTIYTDLDLEEF